MSWGVPRRPKVSTKLGNPNPREGSDGDIQIKGTALGAKLWGKWSGRWWDVPLSKDGVTKFGVTDSNYLSIDRDSVDIFTNKVKVATFGQDTIIGEVGASKSNVQITSGAINLRNNTTTKLQIAANGTISFPQSAKIVVGSGLSDNITIADAGANNGGTYNTVVGQGAGANLTGLGNTFVGYDAGDDIQGGNYNVCIGGACSGAAAANEQIAIGFGVTCDASEQARIGDLNTYVGLDFSSTSQNWAATSDERMKTNIVDSDIGLDFINALRPIKYNDKNKFDWPDVFNVDKSGERPEDPTRILDGFIAQEVKKVMDDMDVTFTAWGEASNDTRQSLQYAKFVVPLVKAVQELSAKLDTMQTEINTLKEG